MSLKPIIEYRKHVEELAREEFAAITRELAAQMDAISRLEKELDGVLQQISGTNRKGIAAADALALYRFADALSSDLATARRLADDLRTQRDAKQSVLMSAARDSRIVEKLGERRDREQVRQDDRREQGLQDETSLRRWQSQPQPDLES